MSHSHPSLPGRYTVRIHLACVNHWNHESAACGSALPAEGDPGVPKGSSNPALHADRAGAGRLGSAVPSEPRCPVRSGTRGVRGGRGGPKLAAHRSGYRRGRQLYRLHGLQSRCAPSPIAGSPEHELNPRSPHRTALLGRLPRRQDRGSKAGVCARGAHAGRAA